MGQLFSEINLDIKVVQLILSKRSAGGRLLQLISWRLASFTDQVEAGSSR
jgi:hypothetical protein